VLYQRAAFEPALVELDAALALAPASSSAWAAAQYQRARTLLAIDRPAEARAALEQALASGSEFAEMEQARALLEELPG